MSIAAALWISSGVIWFIGATIQALAGESMLSALYICCGIMNLLIGLSEIS